MREASLNKKSELELKGENGFKYAMENLSRKTNFKKDSQNYFRTNIKMIVYRKSIVSDYDQIATIHLNLFQIFLTTLVILFSKPL